MRRIARATLFSALVCAATAGGTTACDSTSCEDDLDCGSYVAPDGSSHGDGGDGGSPHRDGGRDASGDARHDSSHGDAAHDATHDASQDSAHDAFTCDPAKTPSEEACVISETYGVFVAPAANGGSDGGNGTRLAPYATISKGITQAKAAGKRVYACAATYAEQVVVNAAVDGVQVYGGLACPELADAGGDAGGGAWTYSGALARLAPAVVGYALDVENLAIGAHFEDLGFVAQPATALGTSSIAVLVNGSQTVSLTRANLAAGSGAMGTAGTTGSNYSETQASLGNTPLGATPQFGAASLTCTCGDNSISTGGGGGNGSTASPGGGSNGLPSNGGTSPNDGIGGSWSLGSCANGHNGNASTAAAGGQGATSAGTLSASGWTLGAPGAAGGTAPPAQGGGGGSGGTYLTTPSGGGGGGGCGGCGGAGGTGGGTGGSSFALLSVSSSVTLDACTLASSTGGAGGMGAVGQAGEPGGDHGNGAGNGCQGGGGGNGGSGGGGGGGAGGLSVAIGYMGTQPQTSNGTTTTAATTPAQGGPAGAGGSPAATNGATGVVQAVMSLTGDAG